MGIIAVRGFFFFFFFLHDWQEHFDFTVFGNWNKKIIKNIPQNVFFCFSQGTPYYEDSWSRFTVHIIVENANEKSWLAYASSEDCLCFNFSLTLLSLCCTYSTVVVQWDVFVKVCSCLGYKKLIGLWFATLTGPERQETGPSKSIVIINIRISISPASYINSNYNHIGEFSRQIK